MKNQKRNNRTLLLLGGVAAGAALGYFLNSKRGRALTKSLADQGILLKDNLVEKSSELSASAKSQLSEVVEIAKDVAGKTAEGVKTQVGNLKATAKSALVSATDTTLDKVEKSMEQVESTTNTIKKGVKKAKSKINGAIEA